MQLGDDPLSQSCLMYIRTLGSHVQAKIAEKDWNQNLSFLAWIFLPAEYTEVVYSIQCLSSGREFYSRVAVHVLDRVG